VSKARVKPTLVSGFVLKTLQVAAQVRDAIPMHNDIELLAING
jgi:hypothetical protein